MLYESLKNMQKSEMERTHVQLASGLVVDAHRLAMHLHRRHTRMPAGVKPPDRFYFCETALSAIQTYDVGITSVPTFYWVAHKC